jgi:uncharacterized membrane protein YgcG
MKVIFMDYRAATATLIVIIIVCWGAALFVASQSNGNNDVQQENKGIVIVPTTTPTIVSEISSSVTATPTVPPRQYFLSDIPWDTLWPLTNDQVAEEMSFFDADKYTYNTSVSEYYNAEGYMSAQIRGYVKERNKEVTLREGGIFKKFVFFNQGDVMVLESVVVSPLPQNIHCFKKAIDNPTDRSKIYLYYFYNQENKVVAVGWGDGSLGAFVHRGSSSDSSSTSSGGDSSSASSDSSGGGGSGGGGGGDVDSGGPVGGVGA